MRLVVNSVGPTAEGSAHLGVPQGGEPLAVTVLASLLMVVDRRASFGLRGASGDFLLESMDG